ncbi:MAG: arsenic-transporting ATPase [Actinobacteria bacterium]|jgi:arsenite-transporting ATPase|nr:arsenic-transporting ATPase [Actinomycetota bacterium]|tara:strand:+ start:217 stop:1380 length:1164 start_codon:yes stop_codon:yes gene_type:complete
MARLLLFGGKGGVGKTTTSTSTAVGLADSGLKVLLVSSDPAHSTSDSLGVQLGPEPTPVEGVEGLWGLELDPEARISDHIPKLTESLGPMLGGQDPELNASEMVLPGLDEAMAFDELLKHLENPDWDVIVFDTAPTGHTLRFLALPEIIEKWAEKIIRMHRLTGGIRALMFGAKEGEKMRDELEKFRRRVLHVRRILCNPEVTRFTLVTIPEKMGVNETLRAYESLAEFNLPVSGCVINRMTPNLDNDFIQTRRINERENVDQLRKELPDLHLHEVELKDSDIHGLDLLRSINSELHGEITISDGLGPFSIGLGLEVHRGTWSDGDDVMLHLPGIVREDLSLRSEAGVVYVGINSREHPVPFDRPAKASQVKAKLENDILKLTFPEE